MVRGLVGGRKFLLGELKKFVDYCFTYPFWSNPDKQEYIDYLKSRFPLEKFPQMYPPEEG